MRLRYARRSEGTPLFNRKIARSIAACASVVIVLICSNSSARADLIVSDSISIQFPHMIRRFDSITGQFIQDFGQSEEFEGVTIAPNGNLLVASNILGDGGVYQYDWHTGQRLSDLVQLGAGGFSGPFGMTLGPDHTLYVCSTRGGGSGVDGILRYSSTTGAFLGTFVPGGSGGLTNPFDVEFGPEGRLYVSDGGPFTTGGVGIRRFNGATGAYIDTLPLGGAGGMAFRGNRLFVTSLPTNSVVSFDLATGASTTFVAPGSGGLSGPTDLAFGPDGNLYVLGHLAQFSNGSILRYDGTTGAFIDTFVNAQTGPANFMIFTDVPEPTLMALGAFIAVALNYRKPARRRG